MSYLDHIALTSGQHARSLRSEVAPDTLARMRSWLQNALAARHQNYPLPGAFADYTSTVLTSEGALLVTVWGKTPQVGKPLALVSFGVAVNASHASRLWEMLTSPGMGATAPGLSRPSPPFLAVLIHPTGVSDPSALEWLPDFERSVAWAWISDVAQPPDLHAV